MLSALNEPHRQVSQAIYWSGLAALALAAVLVIWTAADLFWLLLPADERVATEPRVEAMESSGGEPAAGGQVADLHLFGQAGVAVQATTFEVPETQLDLHLLGTFAADDPTAGLAIIADEQGEQGHYGAGDELPGGAELKEVHADRVVIERQGRQESLRLVRAESDREGGRRGGPVAGTSNTSNRGPRAIGQQPGSLPGVDWESARNQSRLDLEKMKQLGQQIRATTHRENGKPIGVRLTSGASSAAVRKLGLRNSDIILSVNGIPLTDPSRQLELMNLLNEQSQFQVRLRRNDREMTLNIDASQLQTP